MALCPICRNPLPDAPGPRCPSCGAELQPEPSGIEAAGPVASVGAVAAVAGEAGRGIPWDERDRLGVLTALVETTRQVLGSPSSFFRAMPRSGGLGSPLLYALIVGWLGVVAASLYQALFRTIVGSSLSSFADRPELAAMLGWVEGWLGLVIQLVFGGIFVLIGVFIAAAVFHLVLLLLGGARRDFEATVRVVSFSQASSVLLLVPFCGQPIAFVWTLVLYVIGLAAAHEIGHGKAAAAVLLPLLLLCCCCLAGLALVAMGIAGVASQIR